MGERGLLSSPLPVQQPTACHKRSRSPKPDAYLKGTCRGCFLSLLMALNWKWPKCSPTKTDLKKKRLIHVLLFSLWNGWGPSFIDVARDAHSTTPKENDQVESHWYKISIFYPDRSRKVSRGYFGYRAVNTVYSFLFDFDAWYFLLLLRILLPWRVGWVGTSLLVHVSFAYQAAFDDQFASWELGLIAALNQ